MLHICEFDATSTFNTWMLLFFPQILWVCCTKLTYRYKDISFSIYLFSFRHCWTLNYFIFMELRIKKYKYKIWKRDILFKITERSPTTYASHFWYFFLLWWDWTISIILVVIDTKRALQQTSSEIIYHQVN